MDRIKCPACWSEMDREADRCPVCGFVFRESTGGNGGPYRNEPAAQPSVKTYISAERSAGIAESAVDRKNSKARRDKKIMLAAAIAVCLIVAIGIGKGVANSRQRSYGSSYSAQMDQGYSGSSGVSGGYNDYAVTTGNEGALNKAISYLNVMGFSYSGLIEQLEYEGFSESEATYGADHCGADWNEQALRKALSYLDSSAFSESGLQEQLEYEGFTSSQAAYGVANCGADWDEQAVKKAVSYLRTFSFTRSELIEQLEYEGFTYEQAAYGAAQNGL